MERYETRETTIVIVASSHELIYYRLARIFLVGWWQPSYDAPNIPDLIIAFIMFLCVPNGA